ncbi:MAG: RNA 2',3'-cyclic phosphodiesterase [Actinobacteria bacterium]|nr:RNA 2',3'-cyclic phosphodiesterase [Actinomycetota bacterium]
MTSAASVEGRERILRLFLGLRLSDEALDAVERWQRDQLERMRVVPREHLHVTLAFLGGRPDSELPAIVEALRGAAAAVPGEIRLTPARYRETRAVAMLVCEDEGGRAGILAADLHGRLEALGVYRREARPWLPHLTVGRFRQRAGLRPDLANMGTYVLVPSGASAYLSRLQRGGAQYEILETVALGGS